MGKDRQIETIREEGKSRGKGSVWIGKSAGTEFGGGEGLIRPVGEENGNSSEDEQKKRADSLQAVCPGHSLTVVSTIRCPATGKACQAIRALGPA